MNLTWILLLGIVLVSASGCASWSPQSFWPAGSSWAVKPSQPELPPLGPAALSPAESAQLCWKTAEEMERAGNDLQAAALYEQARTLDPQAYACADRLARLYDRLNADEAAQREYRLAVDRSPDDADLLNDVGVFHLRREHWADAEAWFRRALDAQPGHDRAAVNLAVCLGMQGHLGDSYEAFVQSVGPAAAYCNLGVLLARQGRTGEAREHLQHALSLDRSLQPAHQLLAQLDRQ